MSNILYFSMYFPTYFLKFYIHNDPVKYLGKILSYNFWDRETEARSQMTYLQSCSAISDRCRNRSQISQFPAKCFFYPLHPLKMSVNELKSVPVTELSQALLALDHLLLLSNHRFQFLSSLRFGQPFSVFATSLFLLTRVIAWNLPSSWSVGCHCISASLHLGYWVWGQEKWIHSWDI